MKIRIPPDYLPSLNVEKLPAEEKENARIMMRQIDYMEDFASDVEAAVELYHTCKAQMRRDITQTHLFHKWESIACRAGAMDLYQFAMSMQAAKGLAFKCPTLAAQIDRAALKKANAIFDAAFPSYEKLRHSVAHEGELSKDQKAIAENAMKESIVVKGVLFSANGTGLPMGNIINDTFTNTIDGQIVSYDLNARTVEALRDTQTAFISAFALCADQQSSQSI